MAKHPPSTPLICPAALSKRFFLKHKIIKGYGLFYMTRDRSYFSRSSYYAHHVEPLYWCNNKESEDEPSWCGACSCKKISTTYYFCNVCNVSYHKECVECSALIKSPFHPKHHLQLIVHHDSPTDDSDDELDCELFHCTYCGSSCAGNLATLFYFCFICEFSLHVVCASKSLFLNYQKRHEHTLNHFPRKTDLICDVCGLVDSKSFIYLCLQCGFVVHTKCIYLPYVIQISRHEHRLSFTYSPPTMSFYYGVCGVCRQKVDENYGQYRCRKTCDYVVHSKCATRKDVWNGKELEQEPEEKEYENLNSFEVKGDGIIQHFSHSHHMKFEKNTTETLYYGNKRCQACILPFYGGDVYNCMDSKCDFVLHDACANLPRTKHHVAHPYPFILQVSEEAFFCGYCNRLSCGFRYMCSEGGESINLDVRCAAVSEPFDHQSHTHPLFLSNELRKYRSCSICKKKSFRTLNCIECDFSLCFYCVTLPYKVGYEHDEHFLTLSYEDNASLNWCEVCEETLDSHEWLYTCNECGIAFHIACLVGKCAFYVKSNITLDGDDEDKYTTILNNGLTRPICKVCKRRCQDKLLLQRLYDGEEVIVCYRHWEVEDT